MPRNRCLFLLAATAFAQQTANLTGTVTNSVTGEPVPRAHVTLSGKKVFGTLTDGEGKFSITRIAPGGYSYAAERVGFTSEVHAGNPGVDLNAGDNSLALKLIPVGSIAGRVLDADGEPVQLANVQLEGPDGGTATTDNKGRYRIGGLRPGKYRVKVLFQPGGLPGEIRTDGSKQIHYRSTYYPGAPTSKEATRVTVGAGSDVTGIDIPLLTTPIVKVSGKILDIPAGAKGPSINVGYEPTPDSNASFGVPAAKDGSFVIWGLEPGKYRLRGQTDERDDRLQSATIELDLGTTDVGHLELRLVPPFDLSGHIEYENGQARAAAKTTEQGLPARFIRHIQLWDELRSQSLQAEIRDDDTFKFEKVFPGRYSAGLFLGRTYLKSLIVGSVESADGTLDVRNGSSGDPVTLLVSANWAEIGGTVSDSHGPVANAVVSEGGGVSTSTDSNGHYSFSMIRPGVYKLLAGGEELDVDSEEYENAMVTVEVHAGDKITQDLKTSSPPKL